MHYPHVDAEKQVTLITPHNYIYKTEQTFTNDMSPADVLGKQ